MSVDQCSNAFTEYWEKEGKSVKTDEYNTARIAFRQGWYAREDTLNAHRAGRKAIVEKEKNIERPMSEAEVVLATKIKTLEENRAVAEKEGRSKDAQDLTVKIENLIWGVKKLDEVLGGAMEPGLNSYKIVLDNAQSGGPQITVEENGKIRGKIYLRHASAMLDFGGDKIQVAIPQGACMPAIEPGCQIAPEDDNLILAWRENKPE